MGANADALVQLGEGPAAYPFRFTIAGDTGAWPDPTADGIFSELLRQMASLEPAFFVNLGDFAGPGAPDRHAHYLELVRDAPFPTLAVLGNHDLRATYEHVHGPATFAFDYGNTRFVVLDTADGELTAEQLAFADEQLREATHAQRVVLTHMPPKLDGRFAPHADWSFEHGEAELLELLRERRVGLLCCAHVLAFDHHVHDGTHIVISGAGGAWLCSHFAAPCPHGAFHHFVEISIGESGEVSGRVFRAFAGATDDRTYAFA